MFSRIFRRDKPSAKESTATTAQPAPTRTIATELPVPSRQPVAEPDRGSDEIHVPDEKIAQRAYQLWCDRGKPHGSEHEDWFNALAQLRDEFLQGTGSSPRKPR